jgi:hypothetical protein
MAGCPLHVFTDRAYLPEGVEHCQMLVPFWGNPNAIDGYSTLEREGKEFLRLTAPETAEVALLPFDGDYLLGRPTRKPCPRAIALAAQFVERARGAGLKTIVLVNSDKTDPIRLRDVIVFRTALNRRTRAAHEFALPTWQEDLVKNHLEGQIVLRERPDVASMGFCGLAATRGPRLRRRVKLFAHAVGRSLGFQIEPIDGIYLRREAMEALARCPEVRTQFIVRTQYYGGAARDNGVVKDPAQLAMVRREYVQNLVDNDYALSLRGYGNFSFRFFEAMSLGRVPLLIDTDCVLPFDFLHDYRDYCVIVPEARLGDAGRAVSEFHSRLSPQDFLDAQRRARDFWLKWLSPEGFFRNLALHWRGRPAPG